jgi:hypothetical protein
MGGTVSVKSILNEGSTFSILFKVMCKVPNEKVIENKQSHRQMENISIIKSRLSQSHP